jgi:hypothetical protein
MGRHPLLADAVEALFADLKTRASGSIVCLPDLAEAQGVDLDGALALVSGLDCRFYRVLGMVVVRRGRGI